MSAEEVTGEGGSVLELWGKKGPVSILTLLLASYLTYITLPPSTSVSLSIRWAQ